MTTTPEAIHHRDDAALHTLKLLADDTRWRLISALRLSDRQAGEIATQVKLPQNLVSYHLGVLREAGLVQAHRSEADARVIYYALDHVAMTAAYERIRAALPLVSAPQPIALPPVTVVFLCTGNSARSQMAEGWLRTLSNGRVVARSAGTEPRTLHPLAVRAMAEAGVDIGYQQAKGIGALNKLYPEVAVTVCDRARETCAPCLDAPVQIHWSIADPVRHAARSDDPLHYFQHARDELRTRVVSLLAALPELVSEKQ